MSKLPLSAEELALPFSKYYEWPFPEIRPEDQPCLSGALPESAVMPLEGCGAYIRSMGKDQYADNGYCFLKDGSYTACSVFMPEVTPAMTDWWFVWLNHPDPSVPRDQGNLKYKIWCPTDHWDHEFVDPDHPEKGMRICESLDLGAGMPRKHMMTIDIPLSMLGLEPDLIQEAKDRGISIKFGCGCDAQGNPGGIGLNLFVPVEGGTLWTSRGWGGVIPKDGKLIHTGGPYTPDEAAVQCELRHNILERRHLAEFLPEIYREYA